MEEKKPIKIIRRSIYSFLQNYHHFTVVAAVLALPFSAASLLSQAFSIPPSPSTSLLSTLHTRLNALFDAAGFPPSLEFFYILSLKLSQTISSSILILPFSLTFLLLAKASVIQLLCRNGRKLALRPSFSSIVSLYFPLFSTYICNSFLLLSANASSFALFFLTFSFFDGFGFSSRNFLLFLSASAAVIYSIILANSLVICNLALVLSAAEKYGGCLAILKACVLVRGRTSTALALALPVNLGLAGIEALFQYRIVKSFYAGDRPMNSMAMEAILIAYLYAVFVVLDTVVNFMFYKSCKNEYLLVDQEDQEDRYEYKIEISEEESSDCIKFTKFSEIR